MTEIIRHNFGLLSSIRELLVSSRNQLIRSVNTAMVQTYWQIGKLIVEDEQNGNTRAEYGKQVLANLSNELQQEFGKGFDTRNLRYMRSFYLTYPIWNTVCSELSWSHYRTLIRIENEQARNWYMQECAEQAWSVRSLERQISVLYYERLLSSQNQDAVKNEAVGKIAPLQLDSKDYLRDPYILDFLNLPHQAALEADVEQGLIDNLQKFLLELGKGFAFVARQQRIAMADQDFYIDLVFYNYILKCFVLIDLKLGKLNHQDVGQMDTYIRIYDQHKKSETDNPTIGLILCSEKSEAVAKYSVLADGKQLFAAKYLPYLPTEEELAKELQRERALLSEMDNQDD